MPSDSIWFKISKHGGILIAKRYWLISNVFYKAWVRPEILKCILTGPEAMGVILVVCHFWACHIGPGLASGCHFCHLQWIFHWVGYMLALPLAPIVRANYPALQWHPLLLLLLILLLLLLSHSVQCNFYSVERVLDIKRWVQLAQSWPLHN